MEALPCPVVMPQLSDYPPGDVTSKWSGVVKRLRQHTPGIDLTAISHPKVQ